MKRVFISTIQRLLKSGLFILLLLVVSSCQDHLFPEAREQSFNEKKLEEAFIHARTIPDLQGLAVARNGIIVAEEYYGTSGAEPDSLLHVMSVTKSITATLIGIALEKGYLNSVDQQLVEFLGEEVDTLNPELGQVTIQQLMMMTAGQGWHELDGNSEFNAFATAPDQLNYILEKPVVYPVGTKFNYSDGAAHLVSVILSEATGMDASAFADAYLFGPMGMGERLWYGDNRGYAYGGVGLCIGIHDMLKIGDLYLNDGWYNDHQIVPAAWIQEATKFHINTNNVIPYLTDYGYFWWLGTASGHDFICANGYGGQFIFVMKDLNLVVCTRTNYRGLTQQKAGENWYTVLGIIINEIVPAVED